jgi:hypothetical protein
MKGASFIIPGMRPPRKRTVALAGAAVLLAAALAAVVPLLPAVALLWRLAGGGPAALEWLSPRADTRIDTRDLSVPTRHGTLRARVYATTPRGASTLVVVPGVHAGGIDEPRQVRFSRLLAARGVTAVVIPLPDLRDFRLTARSTDQIEDAVRWVTADRTLAPDGRAGLAGISFAGGLAIVAAGRPALAGRLRVVLSLGGHGDFGRLLRYYATGDVPGGGHRPPHDYGVAMAALAGLSWMVPPGQVAPLERGIRLYLEAAFDTSETQHEAARLIAAARDEAARLPEPAATILRALVARDVTEVGRRLEPAIAPLSATPALSPERSPPPRAPVFLLHGEADTVIPPSETLALSSHLRRAGATDVRALVTPVLSHVGMDSTAGLLDYWRLATFWTAFRDALDDRARGATGGNEELSTAAPRSSP